jgi:4-hydroxy-4-methyl-2-oxoglutarate aldolase
MTWNDSPAPNTTGDVERRARLYGAATLHEVAGQIGALPGVLRPMTGNSSFAGPAFTVFSPGGDNLWIHRAVHTAPPGSVIVIDFDRDEEAGYWGEVLSHAAFARGVRACVINAQVRDVAALDTVGLPVYARGVCIRGTGKDATLSGALNVPLDIGGAVVRPGDYLVGDDDGIVCVPVERLPEVLDAARARREHECQIIESLYSGRTTLELYGLAGLAEGADSNGHMEAQHAQP